MRLTVVGCSGSVSGPDSVASCYLVEADDGVRTWRVLLDLGPGAVGQAMKYADPAGVDAVLLSHLHADHIADLAGLEVLLRYGPGAPRPAVPVYGPQGTMERIDQLTGDTDDRSGVFEFTPWEPATPVTIGPLRIEPHIADHPVTAYSLRITGPGETADHSVTLTYTGDTDTCDGVQSAAWEADLLLSEAAFQEGRDEVRGIHLTGRRAGELATVAGAKALILTHIPPWTCDATVLAEASGAYSGPIEMASAGATWEL